MRGVALLYIFVNLVSGLLEDNWILITVSASNLLRYVVLIEVKVYEKKSSFT